MFDRFGLENRNETTKVLLDEMKSYKAAAILILRDQPDSEYYRTLRFYKKAENVIDIDTDVCNLMELISFLTDAVRPQTENNCADGGCSPHILSRILHGTRLVSDFKNLICLAEYSAIEECRYLEDKVDALFDLLWSGFKGYIDFNEKENKIECNANKCELEKPLLHAFISHVEHTIELQKDRIVMKLDSVEDAAETQKWSQLSVKLQNILKYAHVSRRLRIRIDDCLKWLSYLI